MTTRTVFAALVVVGSIATPQTARALGGVGHEIVARMAEDQLTECAKTNARALLDLEESTHLYQVARWADSVKGENYLGPSHAVRLPVCGHVNWQDVCREPPAVVLGDGIVDDDEYNPCAAIGIALSYDILADINNNTYKQKRRLQALKNLVHLVGDINQPLHCVEETGKAYVRVPWDVQNPLDPGTEYYPKEELHKVWDSGIIKHHASLMDDPAWWDPDVAKETSQRIAEEILETPPSVSDRCATALTPLAQAKCWALEGRGIARTIIYEGKCPPEDCDAYDKDEALYCATKKTDVPVDLRQGYYSENWPILEKRLYLASVRLAKLLNRALDPQSSLPCLAAGQVETDPAEPTETENEN